MPEQPITLDEYQLLAARTDVESENDDPLIPLLGLAGEVGELAAELKKSSARTTSNTAASRKRSPPS